MASDKVVIVVIVKEKDNGVRYAVRLHGNDAEKWQKLQEEMTFVYYEYNMELPNLQWEKIIC